MIEFFFAILTQYLIDLYFLKGIPPTLYVQFIVRGILRIYKEAWKLDSGISIYEGEVSHGYKKALTVKTETLLDL